MKKILFIFGTRPEAIKLSPVIHYFQKHPSTFETIVAVTGQHKEMLKQVLSIFKIDPDYDLDIMSSNQTLSDLTSRVLEGISKQIKIINPDFLFVQGDTTTTFAASLAAFYEMVPVVHIEAGLRTNNIYSPFPEEINRRMTSSIASIHFAPTKDSFENLIKEGVSKKSVFITGNTVIDSLMYIDKRLQKNKLKYEDYFLTNYKLDLKNMKTILVTGHRRESFGKKFENICYAIKEIADTENIKFVYPVHLNPNVQKPVKQIIADHKNIFLLPPLDYLSFVYLMKNAHIILTDSGGIQEEAPSFGKPVIVMRDNTERMEGVIAGTSRLVGTGKNSICEGIRLLLNNVDEYNKMSSGINPYGRGNSSELIYNHMLELI